MAIAEIVKPVSSIKDVRILHTGGMFGAGGAAESGNGGVGFGEGLAGQLLQVHALKPMIDEILRQGGFKPGDDPVKALAAMVTRAPDKQAVVTTAPAEIRLGAENVGNGPTPE